MADFTVHILGCGSALPTTRHLASSQVVDLRDKLYMIDCGEGTQLQMRRTRIKFARLNHVFISHMHGDHCFGLPGLVSTLGMLGRNGELWIHGPAALGEYVESFLRLFCQGLPFAVHFNPVDASKYGLVMEDRSVSVYSIPLKHRVPCCGYLFAEKERERHIIREMIDAYQVPVREIARIKQGADFVTEDGRVISNERLTTPASPATRYVYCSDTAYSEKIIPWIEGVDCLYHEATFDSSLLPRAKETMHSTALQAAEIARMARVRQLIIGHFSARYTNQQLLLDEARSVFEATTLAKDGGVYKIGTL